MSIDMTWITERIALGGGIWNEENMAELVRMGVTHVINMQIEFDDRPLAQGQPVTVLHNPTDDDFLPKPPQLFQNGVDFALDALDEPLANTEPAYPAVRQSGRHRTPRLHPRSQTVTAASTAMW